MCHLLRGFTWGVNAASLDVLQCWILPCSCPKFCEHLPVRRSQAATQVFYGSKLILGCFQSHSTHANRIKMCWSLYLTPVSNSSRNRRSFCLPQKQASNVQSHMQSLDMKTAVLQLVFCVCYASVEEAWADWFKQVAQGEAADWALDGSVPVQSPLPQAPALLSSVCSSTLGYLPWLYSSARMLLLPPQPCPSVVQSLWLAEQQGAELLHSQQAGPLEGSEPSWSRKGLQGRPTEAG